MDCLLLISGCHRQSIPRSALLARRNLNEFRKLLLGQRRVDELSLTASLDAVEVLISPVCMAPSDGIV
jgi:hypothetical protein